MKQNYAPWELDTMKERNGLPWDEQARFLIHCASLAPSSHNSQPWKFTIKNHGMELRPETARKLPFSDANDRQLYISLGAALANMRIAALHSGWDMRSDFSTLPDRVTITFENAARQNPSADLVHFIPKRSTNRNKYSSAPLSAELLLSIKNDSSDEMRFHVVSEEEERKAITEIVMDATIEAMSDRKFRAELSNYVKPNTTQSPVGMPCFGMLIPTPVSYVAPTMIRLMNMGKLTATAERELLIRHTPHFVIITTKRDDPEAWVKTGSAYQALALDACSRRIHTHPLAAAVQIGNHFQRLQHALKTKMRPQMFFRLGVAEREMPHSPRLSVDKILN